MLHRAVSHLEEEQTNGGETDASRKWLKGNTYLGSPCSIACHPFTIESDLPVGVFIHFSGGEIPPSFEDRVLKKGLNAFQGIAIE